jgi:hypothetical protein
VVTVGRSTQQIKKSETQVVLVIPVNQDVTEVAHGGASLSPDECEVSSRNRSRSTAETRTLRPILDALNRPSLIACQIDRSQIPIASADSRIEYASRVTGCPFFVVAHDEVIKRLLQFQDWIWQLTSGCLMLEKLQSESRFETLSRFKLVDSHADPL